MTKSGGLNVPLDRRSPPKLLGARAQGLERSFAVGHKGRMETLGRWTRKSVEAA